jgi:hypothetical protein
VRLWVLDEHRYGLLPVIRRCWALKGVRVHLPYAIRYQWGYLHEALEAEMNEARRAGKGERTACRLGCRSGHYPRTLVTRVGKLELRVLQDRLSSKLFVRYQRSEKALVVALMEIYVQGGYRPAGSIRSPRNSAGTCSARTGRVRPAARIICSGRQNSPGLARGRTPPANIGAKPLSGVPRPLGRAGFILPKTPANQPIC